MLSRQVAIAGAGIAGLACAVELSRRGWQVTVYERFATSQPVGSGLMLQPTGLVALQRLGLRQSIEQLGQEIHHLHGVSGTATVFDLGYADLAGGLHALGVHRSALHSVLWEAFRQTGARLLTDHTIVGARGLDNSRPCFIDAIGGNLPKVDLLIDASGSGSRLRALVSSKKATSFEYGAVWASVPDIRLAPNALTQRYTQAREMIGYLPIGKREPGGEDLAAFFWSLKTRDYNRWRSSFANWREHVTELWPQMEPIVQGFSTPDDLDLASYSHFTPRSVFAGRLVLVGDAGHSTSPQLGQGANQGLIDAVVLGDALYTDSIESALQNYARARSKHVRFYQFASAVMTPFFQSDSRLLAALRDLSFDRMKAVGPIHRQMLRTLMGLKTGILTAKSPQAIVNSLRESA